MPTSRNVSTTEITRKVQVARKCSADPKLDGSKSKNGKSTSYYSNDQITVILFSIQTTNKPIITFPKCSESNVVPSKRIRLPLSFLFCACCESLSGQSSGPALRNEALLTLFYPITITLMLIHSYGLDHLFLKSKYAKVYSPPSLLTMKKITIRYLMSCAFFFQHEIWEGHTWLRLICQFTIRLKVLFLIFSWQEFSQF